MSDDVVEHGDRVIVFAGVDEHQCLVVTRGGCVGAASRRREEAGGVEMRSCPRENDAGIETQLRLSRQTLE